MAQGDILKRYLDAGLAFTQMTRERAEAIVQDLVENGEIRRNEARKRIEELVDRSQKNTEELLSLIRREVAEQLKNLGLEDLARRAGLSGESPAAEPATVSAAPPAPVTPPSPVSPVKPAAAKKVAPAVKKAAPAVKKPAGAKKAAGAAKKAASKATKKA